MAAAESRALAVVEPPLRQPSISDDMIRRAAGAVDMPDDQFEIFLAIAHRTGLDPLSRQIYAIPRKVSRKDEQGKWHTETAWTIQTGIDGYRSIAVRTRVCAGIDDPIYDTETADHPNKATATVWRFVQGQRVPFSASARWSEYVQTKAVYDKSGRKTDETEPTDMWKRMPYNQLGKCAEALALRRAFPVELSGTYTDEEMAQADNFVEATATIHEDPTALAAPQCQTVEERYEAERPQRDTIAAAAQKSADETVAEAKTKNAAFGALRLRALKAGIESQEDWEAVCIQYAGSADPDRMSVKGKQALVAYVAEQEAAKATAQAKVKPAEPEEPAEPDIEPATLDLADIETGHPVP